MTWLAFSSRDICRDTLKGPDGKFDWSNVRIADYVGLVNSSENADGLTNRSIIFCVSGMPKKNTKKSTPKPFITIFISLSV